MYKKLSIVGTRSRHVPQMMDGSSKHKNMMISQSLQRFWYTRHYNNNDNNINSHKKYYFTSSKKQSLVAGSCYSNHSHLVSSSSSPTTAISKYGKETKSKSQDVYGISPILYSMNGGNGSLHHVGKMRVFSSVSTPTSLQLDSTLDDATKKNSKAAIKLNEMRAMTTHLVQDIPLGEFSSDDMMSANRSIEFWAKQKTLDGIQNVTNVMDRIIDEIAKGNPRVDLSYNTIQLILWRWREFSSKEFPQRSLQILKNLHRIYDHNSVPYRMFIGALTKCGTVESVVAAEKLLDIIIDLHKKGNITSDGGKPCTITFNSILTGWEKTKSTIGGQKATNVLHKMIGLYRLGNHAVRPDSLSFNMTISAIINGYHPPNDINGQSNTNITRDVRKIYDEMIYFHKHEDRYIKPDVSTLNNVLNAYAKSNSHESAQMALDLLRHTQSMYNNKELDILPNTTSYNIIIGALSSTSDNESSSYTDDDSTINLIEKLMDEMESSYTTGSNIDAKVDTVTYNSLIRTYCCRKDKTKSALRADSVLKKMTDLYEKGNKSIQPDNVSFNSVISAYAKMPSKDAAQKASDVLHRMQAFHDAGQIDVKPDTVSISLIISALLQSAKFGADKAMMANQALAILKRMEDLYKFGSTESFDRRTKPDAITYTSAIECLVIAGGKGCGEKAEQILKSMEEMYFHDNMASDDLKPDTTSYNAVLRAYANSGERDAAEKTETFLKRMMNNNVEERAGRRENVLHVQPNVLSFGVVIDAWAKSGERNAPQRAERLLEFMIDQSKNDSNHIFKPNSVIFSSCITAWSRSKYPKAAERASLLLEKMETLRSSSSESNNDLRPNAYVYSSVLEAWSKCPNKGQIGPKVEEILDGMKCKANVVILNTAIKAIGRSMYPNKAEKATQILDKLMSEHGVLPNIRTYNALLTCFASTQKSSQNPHDSNLRKQTWNAAFRLLENIRSDNHTGGSIGNQGEVVKPDAYTYPAMLKVCQNLLPSLEKDTEKSDTFECIKKVVDRCCEDGMVDALFLNNLKSYVNNDIQLRVLLFGNDLKDNNAPIQLRTIPKEWKRNVKPNQRKGPPKKGRNRKR